MMILPVGRVVPEGDVILVSVALFYCAQGEEDGLAASGRALAPEPPRATGVGPECHGFCPFSVHFI